MKLSLLYTLSGHEERVWHASWSPDGSRLATCSEDRTVRIWVRSSSSQSGYICSAVLDDGQARTVRSCEWSPDGQLVASASFDGTIAIWECTDKSWSQWDRIAVLEGHDNEVKSVAWSNDGQYVATCGRDKKIWVWERLDSNDFECAGVLDGHTQDVKFILWHPKLPILFSTSYDDTIKIWAEDGGDWWCARTLIGHTSTVWGLAFDRLGTEIVTCSDDRSVCLWKAESPVDPKRDWQRISTIRDVHRDQPIYTIDWNVVHQVIATGGGDNSISLVPYEGGSPGGDSLGRLVGSGDNVYRFEEAHTGDINCLRWNPLFAPGANELLASVSDDGDVKVWRLELD